MLLLYMLQPAAGCCRMVSCCAGLDASADSGSGSQPDDFLSSVAHIEEGPVKAYVSGRTSGFYRPDPRQENTVLALQQLYEQLQQMHGKRRRPSGLTTVNHIVDDKERQGW